MRSMSGFSPPKKTVLAVYGFNVLVFPPPVAFCTGVPARMKPQFITGGMRVSKYQIQKIVINNPIAQVARIMHGTGRGRTRTCS